MRVFFSILLLLPFSLWATLTTYYTFEYGAGYRDDGGRYMAHGLGTYVTLPADRVPSSWYHNFVGVETVIAGTKDDQLLTPYVAVIFRNAYQVNDTPSNMQSPFANGTPYSGGPLTVTDGNFDNPNDKDRVPVGRLPPNDVPPDMYDLLALLKQFYINGTTDANGDYSGFNDMVRIVESGNNYILYDADGNIVTQWPKSMGPYAPITYTDSSGNVVNGWYNPATGQITSTRPSDGSALDLAPVVSSIEGVQSRQDLLRTQLIQQLGAAGNSWVYDCKLSLADLQSLATSLGITVTSINDALHDSSGSIIAKLESQRLDLSGLRTQITQMYTRQGQIKSSTDSIKTSVANVGTTLSSVDSRLGTANSTLSDIRSSLGQLPTTDYSSILEQIRDKLPDETASLPSLPLPDLSGEPNPDESLPFSDPSFAADAETSFRFIQDVISDPAIVAFGYNGVFTSLLTRMVGPIPSVGSDPVMFSVHWTIPYIGVIDKTFSFADWPVVQLFREVACWAIFIFFALACFKTLHRSLI